MNGKFFKLNIRVNTIQQIQSHYHIDHTTKAMNMSSLGNHNIQVIFQNNQVYHLQKTVPSICPKYSLKSIKVK